MSNLRKKVGERDAAKLTVSELQTAHQRIIKHVQETEFAEEVADLSKGRQLRSSSKILSLHPFLDEQNILRETSYNSTSQCSIFKTASREGAYSVAACRTTTFTLLYKILAATIRERYWLLKGRDLARRTCRECIRCTRTSPHELSQLMGPLLSDRIKSSRAFTVTGVDFAGPITTLVNKGRGRKINKSYIALFVCFSTRAIHLEATSELTSTVFLATLRRFTGQRGRPCKMYSDNATNFVGANRELREMYQFVKEQVKGDISEVLANEGID
ncbi:PREDICTED: uncharacterized protein LOC105557080 [Vollenhovia emeryi]|uniref:uncharacterized protein LOC105557080 n=1 Tax=Vollenhovia emeryi TaxID=411798 RepID=UPI0005F48CD6|nr:PREDICTED: uncharacterized protein LOC105557080 [Vollenhovia emeryi]